MLLISVTLAADPTGVELLDKIINLMNPENAQGIMKQTIVTTSGKTRTLEYQTYAGSKGKNSLMRYLSPSRVKGNAMLMTDYVDNIWMFNKRTKRVRKLASHAKKQKFEGSDFTYEDMGAGDVWKKDFSPKKIGFDKNNYGKCLKLELKATNDDISYSRIVCWLRQEDFFPVQFDYYDKNKRKIKTLFMENIKTVEGFVTPMKMTMKNLVDNTETSMEYLDITYDVTYDKDFFTERNLKR